MSVLCVDLCVAILLLISLKFLMALFMGVQASKELTLKDNPAFGIAVAGGVLAVMLMLTGVLSGHAASSLAREALEVSFYGGMGIVLMLLTRFIFDRYMSRGYSIQDYIKQGNIAASVTDAGNVIATALIVRSVILWSELTGVDEGLISLAWGYFVSQLLLTFLTLIMLYRFKKRHKRDFFKEIESGNLALAFRFVGVRIGAALAISAASAVVPHALEEPNYIIYGAWLSVAGICLLLTGVLTKILDYVFLFKTNVYEEVVEQKNLAVGVFQAALMVSVSLLILVLMS